MATVVIGDNSRKSRNHVVHLGQVQQKFGELVNLWLQAMSGAQNLLKVVGDHRRTRPGGNHHILGSLEHGYKMPGYLGRLLSEPAVECRLPATGLRLREIYRIPKILKYF